MKIEKLLLLYIIHDFHYNNIDYKRKKELIIDKRNRILNHYEHYKFDKEIYNNTIKIQLYINIVSPHHRDIKSFIELFKEQMKYDINDFHYILDLHEKNHLESLIKLNNNKTKRKNKI